jgi:hypothetical protein
MYVPDAFFAKAELRTVRRSIRWNSFPGNEGVMVCRHVAGHDCWVLRDKPATEKHPLACRCSSLPGPDNVKLPTRASIPIEGHIVG